MIRHLNYTNFLAILNVNVPAMEMASLFICGYSIIVTDMSINYHLSSGNYTDLAKH